LIYYCVDEYTAFTGVSNGLKEIEEDLFRRADLVIVFRGKVVESKKHFNENTLLSAMAPIGGISVRRWIL